MTDHATFMQRAIALADQGMEGRHVGPFGAVIVRAGKFSGRGCSARRARHIKRAD